MAAGLAEPRSRLHPLQGSPGCRLRAVPASQSCIRRRQAPREGEKADNRPRERGEQLPSSTASLGRCGMGPLVTTGDAVLVQDPMCGASP